MLKMESITTPRLRTLFEESIVSSPILILMLFISLLLCGEDRVMNSVLSSLSLSLCLTIHDRISRIHISSLWIAVWASLMLKVI